MKTKLFIPDNKILVQTNDPVATIILRNIIGRRLSQIGIRTEVIGTNREVNCHIDEDAVLGSIRNMDNRVTLTEHQFNANGTHIRPPINLGCTVNYHLKNEIRISVTGYANTGKTCILAFINRILLDELQLVTADQIELQDLDSNTKDVFNNFYKMLVGDDADAIIERINKTGTKVYGRFYEGHQLAAAIFGHGYL